MWTELSTELITHKLQIKGESTRYISKETAEMIFSQLTDESLTRVNIINQKTLTYISAYKWDVRLTPIEWEEKNFEDTLFASCLSHEKKERVRIMWNNRKNEWLPQTDGVLRNIIESFK